MKVPLNFHSNKRISASASCTLTALFFLLLTLLDIIVVESYYRPTGAWSSIWLWHSIYFILYVGIPILMSLRLRSLIPLSIIIAFTFGIEDTMFYALQSTLPARYIGAEILGVWQPSLATALTFNLLGLVLICLFLVAASSYEHRQRHQST